MDFWSYYDNRWTDCCLVWSKIFPLGSDRNRFLLTIGRYTNFLFNDRHNGNYRRTLYFNWCCLGVRFTIWLARNEDRLDCDRHFGLSWWLFLRNYDLYNFPSSFPPWCALGYGVFQYLVRNYWRIAFIQIFTDGSPDMYITNRFLLVYEGFILFLWRLPARGWIIWKFEELRGLVR